MQILSPFIRGIRFLFILPVLIYQQVISPLLPGACIYSPTCSTYFRDAVMKHGVFRGSLLGISRIFRCAGGLYTGGEDPVPETFSLRSIGEGYKKFWARKK